jgi:DNA-binding GntR family transcriptional regulator
LGAEGLVHFQAHKSAIVAPLSLEELRQIYDIRLQLDPYAGALAATHAEEAALGEIKRLAQAPVSDNPNDQVALNRAFHRSIYSRSGNALLIEILDRLWESTDRYRIRLLSQNIHVLSAVREHIQIANALRARDPDTVASLIHSHINNARQKIEHALE